MPNKKYAGSNTLSAYDNKIKEYIANNTPTYSAAGSHLGLVKSGNDFIISDGVISVNDDITLEDIAALTGDIDIETGNYLTLSSILGDDITQADIDALFT